MIVVATWPLMTTIQGWLWGRRWLAVALMTLMLLCVLVVPLSLAIGTIVSNADEVLGWARSLATFKMPPPPEWVGKLPFIGDKAHQAWQQVAAAGIEQFSSKAAPYAVSVIKWFIFEVGGFGVLFVQFLLTVVLAAAMYANGEHAAQRILKFGGRLAGPRGEKSARLAGQTIRGVALGVVVTAFAQSVMGGVGLAIAGVPFAAVLTAMMAMLCIAQVGPFLVLAPAVAWLYWSDNWGWGTFLLVWTIIVGTMDNFLRPVLIRKGADLPLLLIFAGVIGGLMAMGLIGIFVGPVVLAVAQTLLAAWVDEQPEDAVTTGSHESATE